MGFRVTSKRSGSSNATSSWLAERYQMTTVTLDQWLAGELGVVRDVGRMCMTGLEYLTISSTAVGKTARDRR